jgi:hypothetical protein
VYGPPKRQNYCRLIAKSDNRIKTTWNVIKHETGKLHLTEHIPALLIIDDEVKDLEVIADAFNTFCLAVTEKLNFHQELRGDAILILKEAFRGKFHGVNTIPTTETEIKSIIHFLRARNSSSYV